MKTAWREGMGVVGAGARVMVVFMALTAWAVDRYVSPTGTNDTGNGYNTPAGAATNIQHAISVCASGDVVWVAAGTYETGSVTNFPTGTLLPSRVAITNVITVRSVGNDPVNTIIKGAWDPSTTNGPLSVRCVAMTNGASLIGFTLSDGSTFRSSESSKDEDRNGAGVWCQSTAAFISNCVISGNRADQHGGGAYKGALTHSRISGNSAGTPGVETGGRYGGGVSQGVLLNCVVSNNWAGYYGGGVYVCVVSNSVLTRNRCGQFGQGAHGGTLVNCLIYGNGGIRRGGGANESTLYNCTVVGNSSQDGNGTRACTVHNSIVYFNAAPNNSGGTFHYSCTDPGVSGTGNITNNPMFVTNGIGYDMNHVPGNYRLRRTSACINRGTNQMWMGSALDFDGLRRVRDTTVDMGAFEWVPPSGSLVFVQ